MPLTKKLFNLAVLTSGADASGMNFALSSVVKYAGSLSCNITGFYDGFKGLMKNKYTIIDSYYFENLEDRGGTLLRTARTSEFKTENGINRAVANIKKLGIDGLILIGGDGTFRGGHDLHKKGINVIGIPASIYNDIAMTDYSIGFDSALNTIEEMVSNIRDTASSHNRLFIVEVMGKSSGNIALYAGLACAADYIFIPEIEFDLLKITQSIKKQIQVKRHIIIITAEGAAKAHEVAASISSIIGQEVRISVIGYLQRGGPPSALDRILAARFAKKAVDALIEGKSNLMTAIKGRDIVLVAFDKVIKTEKQVNRSLYRLAHILARH
jgi:6-phosphofructokinase 1